MSRLLSSTVPRWVGVHSHAIYLYGLTVRQLLGIITHLQLHYAAFLDVPITAVLVELSYSSWSPRFDVPAVAG